MKLYTILYRLSTVLMVFDSPDAKEIYALADLLENQEIENISTLRRILNEKPVES